MAEREIAIVETDKGTLTIGQPAFIDGRDLDARPPLTVMAVNIWGNMPRTRIVCQLAHGSHIDIVSVKFYAPENRHYFLIRRDDCQGWLTEGLLSNRCNEPIGEEIS